MGMQRMANWGNFPVVEADQASFALESELPGLLAGGQRYIPRGLGRSYGDASLAPFIVSTNRYNKMLRFDEATGELTCQAGVSLDDILQVFVPRGWFPYVTPGTKYVTVGGAIAADVHGKNHHLEGSFADHVVSIDLMLPDGRVVTCGPGKDPDLFETTCGGMGLTGLILRATLQLRRIESAYIREEVVPARNLDAIMELFGKSAGWTYTVAWIDCLASGGNLGRSIMLRGEHASAAEVAARLPGKAPLGFTHRQKLQVPFTLPGGLLNRWSVRAFNAFYYHHHAAHAGERLVNYDTFFYPLDFVGNWNRIYGPRGFAQYQFVLPLETSRDGLTEILGRISKSGSASFLAVLKLFGRGARLVSFPEEGYTLALDFPISDKVLALMDELDVLVRKYRGRIYLAKDARMSADMFQESYGNFSVFKDRLRVWNGSMRAASLQSDRLGITS